jgi:hypothetical protein
MAFDREREGSHEYSTHVDHVGSPKRARENLQREPVDGSKTIDLEGKRVKDGCVQLSGTGKML